ncbi:MAG: serine--tRNA ligase [Candidatus Anstonellales archaeon]
MLDPDFIRNNHDIVIKKFVDRGYDKGLVLEFLEIDKEWRAVKQESDKKRAEKNIISNNIKEHIKEKKDITKLKEQALELDKKIKELEQKEKGLEQNRKNILLQMPNLQQDDVPIGKDENDNVEIKKWLKPSKTSSDIKPHYELPFFDFERAAKISGHRFALMYGHFAKLERALINFMLNMQILNGYKEVWGPHLVLTKAMIGTGQLPKFEQELYKTDDDLWLLPTAEVMLVNIYREEVLENHYLPIRLCSYTPCYRREAGAYGKDIKGFLRQHQFDKIELVSITRAEDSKTEHEKMLSDAESILKALELPYRVMLLCTSDLGFASAKTYDIEVWLPSQDKYREISSVSNCLDFQARRANIRYLERGELYFAHTLNGSGLAVGRTLIALVENMQEKDGIKIPKALQPYFESDFIHFD